MNLKKLTATILEKNKTYGRQEGRPDNIGFAKWRVQCFYDSLVQGSSSVFQLNICAKNPPLRKAENRWHQLKNDKI
jgi:hypothetical protein